MITAIVSTLGVRQDLKVDRRISVLIHWNDRTAQKRVKVPVVLAGVTMNHELLEFREDLSAGSRSLHDPTE